MELQGPLMPLTVEAFASAMATFRSGRNFAAWLGLVPKQNSTGGKQVLGGISKMGQRDIRRLLNMGAMAVLRSVTRKGLPEGSWLAGMLSRKPRKLVAVALANKMARSAWAMLADAEHRTSCTNGGIHTRPGLMAALGSCGGQVSRLILVGFGWLCRAALKRKLSLPVSRIPEVTGRSASLIYHLGRIGGRRHLKAPHEEQPS